MTSPTIATIPPPTEDAALAQLSVQAVSSCLAIGQSKYQIEIKPEGTTSQSLTIPASALHLLAEALTQIASGNAVKIVPIKPELSTSEVAELLNVSRPYLVELLESGKIPFRKVGPRRRVLFEDVMAYKKRIDAQREQTLAELAAQAQELNMGYQ
jgi:excisionase family DNA binding protein